MMFQRIHVSVTPLIIAAFVTTLAACAPMAPFSATALAYTTSTKVDALALMDKATESFKVHEVDVAKLNTEVDKAYAYAKSRPHNSYSIQQWEILRDPGSNSLGGFLARWKRDDTLGSDYIEEAKKLVSDGFDTISDLETGKKPSGGQ